MLLQPRPFQIVRKIADGGMGAVYEAVLHSAEGTPQRVAVKMLKPEYAADPAYVAMFLHEATVARRLIHPNIVTTYDFGRGETGCWMVMELVRGVSLSCFLKRHREAAAPIPTEFVCFIGAEACQGMHYAHRPDEGGTGRPGLVHRDICPRNVLVGYEGEVKIADFGVARHAGSHAAIEAVEQFGRRRYLSPEQQAGARGDLRSDIFSLSVVLSELLAGSEEESAGAGAAGNLDRPVEAVLRRGLAADPNARYQTAADLGADLLAAGCRRDLAQIREHLGHHLRLLFPHE